MKVYKHLTFPFLKYTSGPIRPFHPKLPSQAWRISGAFLRFASRLCLLVAALQWIACNSFPVSHGKKVFHYNETDGIATLDPAFAKNRSIIWPIHQLYNTLVETDARLRFVPCLAKTWEVSADRKTWLFHLRTDVFFQDNEAFPGGRGRRMTAADIVYSFSRIIDPATASSGAWIFSNRIE